MIRVYGSVLSSCFHYLPLSSHPFSATHQLITPCVFKSACSFHHGCWLLCLDFMDFCYKLCLTKLIFFVPVPARLFVLRLAPLVFNLNTYLSCQLEHCMHRLHKNKNKLFFTQQIPRQFQKTNPK